MADSCLFETVAGADEEDPFCVWYKASLVRLLENGVGLLVMNRRDRGGMSSDLMGDRTRAGSSRGGGVVTRSSSEPAGNSGIEVKL
jgi:hypothetical protein